MGFVLFILGFTIGFFTCNIIRNIKELNRQKSNTVKALSKMEEKNLQKIAKDIQIDYIHMKNQKRIDKKLKEIQRMVKKETVKDKELFYEDTYYFLMIPVIILLLFEWSKFRREII